MYLEHFGLAEPPFRITPHPDFFFDGADRGATLEALIYAVLHEEGIVKVSGEVGSGKTMLCRVLMERLPGQVETIYLATPSIARDEILHAIADELQVEVSGDRTSAVLRELQEQLIRLYGAGRRVVILIDEAHAMPDETLEQVRLLSNLESSRHKLLQIVLFGQPELDQTLAKPSMRQLRDRITHSFRMRPLVESEVGKYVDFRMRAAGYRGPEVFTQRAIRRIARAASGLPPPRHNRASSGLTRRINILADKSLLAAYTENAHSVGARQVRAAVSDSEFTPVTKSRKPALIALAAIAASVLFGAFLHWALGPAADGPGATPRQLAAAPTPEAAPPRAETPVGAPAAQPAASPAATPKPVVRASAPAANAAPVDALASAKPSSSAAPAEAPDTLLSREQLRRLSGYSPAGQRLLAERIAAARNVLSHTPDDSYSVELFITENVDPARMERFLLRARELVPLADVFVIPIAGGGTYRIRVVYGAFSNRAEAEEAERRLPPKYQREFNTSLRSFGDLRRPL